ncbi:hypothetical protein CEXT_439621 [Caerostris extrusa]|uniref:Uncharacterized protein n=1 Tax=Caerostris extrusa TaxID=172846 RepID=A0AAV4RB05_CAEEX|nr:hypothetical protein CEXT_439621 [Caerostris extrusa]
MIRNYTSVDGPLVASGRTVENSHADPRGKQTAGKLSRINDKWKIICLASLRFACPACALPRRREGNQLYNGVLVFVFVMMRTWGNETHDWQCSVSHTSSKLSADLLTFIPRGLLTVDPNYNPHSILMCAHYA